MTQAEGWSQRLVAVIARQVRHYRERRGMSAQKLADETAALGYPIARSVLANLENGRREAVSVAELFVLAAALRVPPLYLVAPVGQERWVEVLPGVELHPLNAHWWAAGERPTHRQLLSADELRQLQRATIGRYTQHDLAVARWEQAQRELAALDPEDLERRAHHQESADQHVQLLAYLRSEMRDAGQVVPDNLPPDLDELVDQQVNPEFPLLEGMIEGAKAVAGRRTKAAVGRLDRDTAEREAGAS